VPGLQRRNDSPAYCKLVPLPSESAFVACRVRGTCASSSCAPLTFSEPSDDLQQDMTHRAAGVCPAEALQLTARKWPAALHVNAFACILLVSAMQLWSHAVQRCVASAFALCYGSRPRRFQHRHSCSRVYCAAHTPRSGLPVLVKSRERALPVTNHIEGQAVTMWASPGIQTPVGSAAGHTGPVLRPGGRQREGLGARPEPQARARCGTGQPCVGLLAKTYGCVQAGHGWPLA